MSPSGATVYLLDVFLDNESEWCESLPVDCFSSNLSKILDQFIGLL
jgi:hypothetical protein